MIDTAFDKKPASAGFLLVRPESAGACEMRRHMRV